jgi:mutator protein MutT
LTEIEVSAAVLRRDGRLLITRRPAGGHLAGLWEFPGGKRKEGESHEECLRRELREELGVEVSVGALLREVRHAYPEKTVRIRFFECRLPGGDPEPIGCPELRWVLPAELSSFEFPPADARLLEDLAGGTG